MPFDRYVPPDMTGHIHEIEIRMFRTIDPNDPRYPEGAEFRISVYNVLNQSADHKSGNLIPHAPQQIRDALQAIMDWAWQKAEDEVLPP